MGAIYTYPNHLTCQQVLAIPPTVGNTTDCWQYHRLLAIPPAVGDATDCWQPLSPLHDLSPIHDSSPLHHTLPPQDTYTSEEEKKRTIQTFMQVSLHVQQTLTQVSLRFKHSSILLNPNSLSIAEPRNTACLLTIGFRIRLVTVVPDKLSELMMAFGARNVEPIIISFNCSVEIKALSIRADTTEVDHVLDFGRLWVLVDTNAVDYA